MQLALAEHRAHPHLRPIRLEGLQRHAPGAQGTLADRGLGRRLQHLLECEPARRRQPYHSCGDRVGCVGGGDRNVDGRRHGRRAADYGQRVRGPDWDGRRGERDAERDAERDVIAECRRGGRGRRPGRLGLGLAGVHTLSGRCALETHVLGLQAWFTVLVGKARYNKT